MLKSKRQNQENIQKQQLEHMESDQS